MSSVDPDVPPAPAALVPLLLVVALGGAAGALARYAVGVLLPHGSSSLPVATLVVNVVGCFLLGVLVAGWPDARWLRPFLGTGVLGGFTTFSTFALEGDRLVDRAPLVAALYVGLTLVLGLGAAWTGLRVRLR